MITVHSIKLKNHHFVYRTVGHGPDILLIHGWLSSSRMWEDLMRHLSPHYRLWAVDLLGFGDSFTRHEGMELTVDAHKSLLAELCSHLQLKPYAVIGHSMGGAIAIKMALDHPELMEKVGLVCPVVTGTFHLNVGQLLGQPLAQKVTANLHSVGAKVWSSVKTLPIPNVFIAPPYLKGEAMRRSLEDFRKASWPATFAGLRSMMGIHLEDHLHKIDKPTLIITGTYDITVPPSDSRVAAQKIKDSIFLEYSNCHHQPYDEEPAHFNDVVGQFLTKDAVTPDASGSAQTA
jgi:pimeloyl-ACP methyl ester carboxylesterase